MSSLPPADCPLPTHSLPMPIFVPLIPFIRRRRRQPRAVAPAALMLVAAEYQEGVWVRLTFDRPIDISAMNGSAITVDDGPLSGTLWVGLEFSGTLIGQATVQIELDPYDPSSSAQTLLNGAAGNGIVASEGGGTWGGVTNVALPFP